jgi:hypothetical protein
MWIMPLSLLGATVFLCLSIFFWKARGRQESGSLKKEAKLLPRKVFVFFVSFVIGTIVYIFLMFVMVVLVINTTLPDWTAYVLYALSALMAIYLGVVIYKKLARMTFR